MEESCEIEYDECGKPTGASTASSSNSGSSKKFPPTLTVVDGEERKDWVNRGAEERMWRLQWKPNRKFGLNINPMTSLMTTVILWSFAAMCLSKPKPSFDALVAARQWITDVASWLYIGTQDIWVIFIIVLYFSKYSKLRLGGQKDKPEYGVVTWFMMLFSCGVGNELFYYGVAEPIYHYTKSADTGHPHRYSEMTPDVRAQFAITQTWYHFGLHGWVVYSIVSLCVAFMGFRKGLPVTMRSCLYPLLGDRIFGIIGDFIDMLSAVCTLMGVCTVLGLGVFDMNSGLARLTGCPSYGTKTSCSAVTHCQWKDKGLCKSVCEYLTSNETCSNSATATSSNTTCIWDDDKTTCSAKVEHSVGVPQTLQWQIGLIIGISCIATLSVVTGMKLGIRTMSITCFTIGMFIWLYVFLSDDPFFFLDVFCQQIGLYIQWLFQIGFHTDAFARHTITPPQKFNFTNLVSTALDLNGTWLTAEVQQGASKGWLDHWTMFYWGWWIAWSPFVGTFIAKISRGRTIGELILGSMIAPMLYAFTWFCVFGSSGIKLERFGEAAGLDARTSPAYVWFNTTGKPSEELYINHTRRVETCNSTCNAWKYDNGTIAPEVECRFASRVSERPHGDVWMDMVAQFGDLGVPMMVISMVAIILYFVTSADSGSLVIDTLCSNGIESSPVPQKIYWAATQGACAIALIVTGRGSGGDSDSEAAKKALDALQAASLCSGLPYTILLCLMCASLWKACKYEYGELQWDEKRFWRTDLCEFLDFRPNHSWARRFLRTIVAIVAPTAFVSRALMVAEKSRMKRNAWMVTMTACFYLAPTLWLSEYGAKGLWYVGWFFFAAFVSLMCALRHTVRDELGIDGNLAEDFFSCLIMYAPVADQLDQHLLLHDMTEVKEDCDDDC